MSSKKSLSDVVIYGRLLSYVKSSWPLFAISFIGFVVYSFAQVLAADLLQFVVDSLGEQQPEAAGVVSSIALGLLDNHSNNRNAIFIAIATSFVIIAVVRGFGFFLGNFYLAKVGLKLIHELRCQIFAQITVLPATEFDKRHSGELLAKVTYHVNQVSDAATNAIKVVLQEGLVVLGILIYMLVLNWKLTLLFVAILPVIAAVAAWVGKQFRRISRKIQESVGDFTQVANEAIGGYREMRLFGGEDYEKNRFYQRSDDNFRQSAKLTFYSSIASPVSLFFVSIALALLIYLALRVSEQGTAGQFVAFISAAAIITRPVRQLTQVLAIVQRGLAACESLFEFIDLTPEKETGAQQLASAKGELEFNAVSFRYGADKPTVLDNISFRIEAGKTCALVGFSGSGKSTLVNLITRFYDNESGDILLDGQSIHSYSRASLRRQIAMVSQHVTLFNDTIYNNIAYGDLASKPREAVLQAIEMANAQSFIEEMPQGIDTVIGENGHSLSGGQRQRLAIARAILKDAPILILDEATSALDNRSEMLIQKALESVMRDRTSIVIAHRLSTIESADNIVVMDKGKIIEQGSHQYLMTQGSRYQQLYEKRFED